MKLLEALSDNLSSVWWWLLYRFHPPHQFHIIKTSLRPGFHEPDTILRSAILGTTQKWVESVDEDWRGGEHKGQREASEVFYAAAKFWREHQKELESGDFSVSVEEYDRLETESQKHLEEVVKHLDHMWT